MQIKADKRILCSFSDRRSSAFIGGEYWICYFLTGPESSGAQGVPQIHASASPPTIDACAPKSYSLSAVLVPGQFRLIQSFMRGIKHGLAGCPRSSRVQQVSVAGSICIKAKISLG
jgi:hypothetical protein